VILGDTCDSSKIAEIAYGADVCVHEATNSFIASEDTSVIEQLQVSVDGVAPPKKGESYPAPSKNVLELAKEAVLAKTIEHGHSTPEMAGQFANDIAAKVLVLTHFSARYKGDDSKESLSLMTQIAEMAKAKCNVPVHTASDFWCLELPRKKNKEDRILEADPISHVNLTYNLYIN